MLFYIFLALVFLLLNEYRLIKKYIYAIMNPDGKLEESLFLKLINAIIKPFRLIKHWINHELLNDELNYNK